LLKLTQTIESSKFSLLLFYVFSPMCRCGLRRQSMMNLDHQSYTGNASKLRSWSMKAGPGKLLFIRILQKYHQVVEELAFPTLYHSFYHVFVFSFLWYVEIRAWRLARYVRFNFSPFCCSRRDVHCYRFGLVESTNSFLWSILINAVVWYLGDL